MARYHRECRECGKAFNARRMSALFCDAPCRTSFNQRRRDRGAELYDFVMAIAKVEGMDFTPAPYIKRLIEAYVAADMAKRAGRPSYQPENFARLRLPTVFGEEGDRR